MKKLFLLLFLSFICIKVYSQSFYVATSNGTLYKITINGSSISQQAISTCAYLSSIAIYKGTMFYSSGTVDKATISDNGLTNCTTLGNAPVSNFLSPNALTAGSNGTLYLAVDRELYSLNPSTMALIHLGTMPYASAGDLSFYKSDLYMASSSGIVKVNINDPRSSTLVIPTGNVIYGLASVAVSSTQNVVYALAINGNKTNIIALDLDNNRLGQVVGTLPYEVYDAASEVEDGLFINIDFDHITATSDCPYTGKGTVQVAAVNAPLDAQYTFNDITNTTGIFPDVSPGTYNVSIKFGNTEKDTIFTVANYVVDKPVLNISKTNPACVNGGKIIISTNNASDKGAYTIQYDSNLFSFDHSFDNLLPGNYHFDIVNNTGCIVDYTDITLTQDACIIAIDSTVVTEECSTPLKSDIKIYSSPGTDTYTYNMNGIINNTGVFNGIDPGNYTITITSAGGGSASIVAIVPDYGAINPVVTYSKRDAVCSISGDIKFSLTTNGNLYKIVYNNATFPFNHDFNGLTEGSYDFTILKPNGCVLDNKTVIITYTGCETVLFPNTFTPNDDGINDVFRPSQNTVEQNFKFHIYNRLGVLMFTSDNKQNGWDGQHDGKPVPAGVYYWVATFLNNEGYSKTRTGYITLIR